MVIHKSKAGEGKYILTAENPMGEILIRNWMCKSGLKMTSLQIIPTNYERSSRPKQSQWCDHSPRARHSGMWSQVGLRKHHNEQSCWRWQNSSWAISNPKRWSCESAAFNIPVNLENSAVATGLEKISFHSNPKERQCQRTLKLSHNCTHLTH